VYRWHLRRPFLTNRRTGTPECSGTPECGRLNSWCSSGVPGCTSSRSVFCGTPEYSAVCFPAFDDLLAVTVGTLDRDEGHGPLLAVGRWQDEVQCDINLSPSPLLEHYQFFPHSIGFSGRGYYHSSKASRGEDLVAWGRARCSNEPVSPPPRRNRACGFHRTRLPRDWRFPLPA